MIALFSNLPGQYLKAATAIRCRPLLAQLRSWTRKHWKATVWWGDTCGVQLCKVMRGFGIVSCYGRQTQIHLAQIKSCATANNSGLVGSILHKPNAHNKQRIFHQWFWYGIILLSSQNVKLSGFSFSHVTISLFSGISLGFRLLIGRQNQSEDEQFYSDYFQTLQRLKE